MIDGHGNVLLLTVDALRADRLPWYGYEGSTTPFLEDLFGSACTFSHAFSASSHTRESIPALLTGQYPDRSVDRKYRLNAESIPSFLPGGYDTAAFHSNPYVSRAYGFEHGFDTFDDDLRLGKHKFIALAQRLWDKVTNNHYARASEINRRSLRWLDTEAEEPFFLWNHYMDVHGPYEPPADFWPELPRPVDRGEARSLYKQAISDPESITGTETEVLQRLYDGEVRYLDAQLRALFDGLEERGLRSDTLVVVTADHGDAFGEHGYFEHPRYVHDELVRVPLCIAGPDLTGRVPATASALDVAPTIAEFVGGATGDLPGESLFDLASDPEKYRERVVFSQARGDSEPVRRFGAHRREASARAEVDADTGALSIEGEHTLGEALRAHVTARPEIGTDTGATDTAPDAVTDRLETLGYRE